MRNYLIGFLAVITGLVLGCAEHTKAQNAPRTSLAAIPSTQRILAIDINQPQKGEFHDALMIAKNAGSQAISLSVFWDDIEKRPGIYKPDVNWLKIANGYYPNMGMKVFLTVSVIDTTANRIPADLKNKAFNDPEVISRFNKLVDYIFTEIPQVTLVGFSIGNEIDIYLGGKKDKWQQYEEFFKQTAAHARTKRPGMVVGAKASWDGYELKHVRELESLSRHADGVFVTYYPLNSDFTMRPPENVGGDVQSLIKRYPNKALYFAEAGYPSGAKNNSSEEKQARFIQEMFKTWDNYPKNIKLIIFTWLHDRSPGEVKGFSSYYGVNNKTFASYLGTLGLRTYNGKGQDKQAMKTLKEEAARREF